MHDARWHAYPQYEAHTASVPRSLSHSPPHRRHYRPAVNTTLRVSQRAPQPLSHRARRLHRLPPPQYSFPIAGFACVPPILCSQFSRSTTTDRSAPSDNSSNQHLRHPCTICAPLAASPHNTSIELLAPPHPLLEVRAHSPSHTPHFSPARPPATVRAASTPLAPHDCHARCALRPHLDSRSALSTPAHARARCCIGPAPSLETACPYPDSIARRSSAYFTQPELWSNIFSYFRFSSILEYNAPCVLISFCVIVGCQVSLRIQARSGRKTKCCLHQLRPYIADAARQVGQIRPSKEADARWIRRSGQSTT